MSVSGYWKILRPVNAIVAGLAAILAYLLATGTVVPQTGLLAIIVFLITGAGNTINDYFDLNIDRINRPDRPLPSGAVTTHGALIFAVILFVTGVMISLFTNPYCMIIAVINSFLLAGYAVRLKSTPLAGNIAVAYLAGSIFLFGGALAGITGLFNNVAIFLITFLAMLSRELLKDAEDVPGDSKAGAKTFPILYGVRLTALIAIFFAIIAVIVSFYPTIRFGALYIPGIAIVDALILYAVLKSAHCIDPDCIRKGRATTYLKYGMFASLVVFTFAALFLSSPPI